MLTKEQFIASQDAIAEVIATKADLAANHPSVDIAAEYTLIYNDAYAIYVAENS